MKLRTEVKRTFTFTEREFRRALRLPKWGGVTLIKAQAWDEREGAIIWEIETTQVRNTRKRRA